MSTKTEKFRAFLHEIVRAYKEARSYLAHRIRVWAINYHPAFQELKKQHDALSAVVEDPAGTDEEIRGRSVDICRALNAVWNLHDDQYTR